MNEGNNYCSLWKLRTTKEDNEIIFGDIYEYKRLYSFLWLFLLGKAYNFRQTLSKALITINTLQIAIDKANTSDILVLQRL